MSYFKFYSVPVSESAGDLIESQEETESNESENDNSGDTPADTDE